MNTDAMKKAWKACLALLLAAVTESGWGGTLDLAVRGKPAEYVIALPVGAAEAHRYAAEELRDYVRKLTGVTLPIKEGVADAAAKAIVLDGTAEAGLGEDGFRILAEGRCLRIVGAPVRGILYGVYDLLERFGGVRWFSSWHEKVPSLDVFSVPDDTVLCEKPAIAVRELFWCDPLSDPVFAARLRLNKRSWRKTPDKLGGQAFKFGRRLGNCHTFDTLVPVKKYFATHPEYFSEVGGKRLGTRTQLCLTNPDVLAIVVSNVVAEIDRDPEAQFFGVSQNDWGNNCTCPACKALDDREGSPSGSMIAFVNAVAEAVAKVRPGKKLETLAYQYTRRPPKTLAPRPDVMVCLCSIECDFGRPIATSTYAQNVKFRDDVRIWAARAHNLYIWDYTTDFEHFLMPFPNIPVLQDNVKFFRDHKAYYVFEQGAYKGWHGEFAELKAWLLAKWLWNPELDRKRLVDEFLSGYYGAAAPFVRTYLDELEAGWRARGGERLSCFAPLGDIAYVVTDAFLDRARTLWQSAETAVQADSALSYNVRMGTLPICYLLANRDAKRWNLTRQGFCPGASVRRLLDLLDEANRAGRPVRQCEGDKKDARRREELRMIAAGAELPPTNVLHLAAGHLSRSGPPDACRDVDDAAAEGGKAVLLANDNYQWYTTFALAPVAFEPGATYTLRVRLRAAATGAVGEIVKIGVYDHAAKKECGGLSIRASTLKDGYAWYDVLDWKPKARQMVYIAPGWFDKKRFGTSPAHAGVWLDALELVRRAEEGGVYDE